ncbi:MAG: recombinase family protein [Bacteriovorax sp.]|nr:recombinase family protein [Bacteriovorax sp.]
MKTVALYVRVSTQEQNHDLQRNELISFVNARGWNLFKIYSDVGSGAKNNRQALNELLQDARNKKFEVVMTWKLDRLFRSLKHFVNTLNQFQDLNIEFVSLKDGFDATNPSGRLLMHLLASFAEFEASIIRERVISGLKAAKVRGVQLGTPRKIDHSQVQSLIHQGLTTSSIAHRLKISEPSVSRIRKIFAKKGVQT